MKAMRWFVAGSFLVVAGCGEADGAKSAGGDFESVEAACRGVANKRDAGSDDPDFDVDTCSAAGDCFSAIYRDEAEQLMLDCLAGWEGDPDCDGDYCSDQIAPSLTPLRADEAHAASRAAYEERCGEDAGDVCRNPVVQLEPMLVYVIVACLEAGCEELEECLDEAVGAYLATCDGDPQGLW